MAQIELNKPDFLKTLIRMHKDSKMLFEQGEYYNCCYLSGYVVECALKFILLKFGNDEEGKPYTIEKIKSYTHKINKLNEQLWMCVGIENRIPSQTRVNFLRLCKYICTSIDGWPGWNPKYRYGEHPKWFEREWSEQYIHEVDKVMEIIKEII